MNTLRNTICSFHRFIVFVFVLWWAAGQQTFGQQTEVSADSTLLFADPHIFFHDGLYYIYGTGAKNGFRVYTSRNMKNWTGPAGAKDGFALTQGDAYGTSRFWAPQVFYHDDRFYLAYAADEHIAIATSQSPLGPFTQTTPQPLAASVKQIDPFVYIDDDGKIYLYHVRVANGGNRIFVAELTDDFSAIKTGTLKECISASEKWETSSDGWTVAEGPAVVKHKGVYYLIFSANDFRNPDYAVGYAVSRSALGPWTKYKGNPILSRTDIRVNGSGHGDVVSDTKGDLFYVFHTHQSDTTVVPRKTAIVNMHFAKDRHTGIDRLVVDYRSFHFLKWTNHFATK